MAKELETSIFLLVSPVVARESTDTAWYQFHKDDGYTGYQITFSDSNHGVGKSYLLNSIGNSSLLIVEDKISVNRKEDSLRYLCPDRIKTIDRTDGSLVWGLRSVGTLNFTVIP